MTLTKSRMSMNIRAFRNEDKDCVIQLWIACGLTRPWNNPEKDIERKLSMNDDLFLVAVDGKEIAGSVMGGYEGHRGWINYLAVHPHHQHKGLGRLLMSTIEQKLLALNCPKINLQVRSGNDEVIAFYQSLGFVDDKCLSFGKRLIHDD